MADESRVRKAQCPRCSHSFGTDHTLSTVTLVCPECAFVFVPAATPQASPDLTLPSSLPSSLHSSPSPSPSPSLADPLATLAGTHPPVMPGPSSGPVPRTRPTLMPGTTVGAYLIERELGRGAMGSVFLARDAGLDRPTALKFLALELLADRDSLERFVRECQILARLRPHPNLVSVYARGDLDGVPYFAMEYVDGPSVKDLLARTGRLAVPRAAALGLQAAQALSFVWTEATLVHRDVKPSNMMLDRNERLVKVTDFGLAKSRTSGATDLTRSGVILGTPDYLAPEQARAERNLDFRTDIYALGATLFHLVAGHPPFHGGSVAEVVSAHLKVEAPRLSSQARGIPDDLDDLVARMLAKRPADRPSTYDEIIAVLTGLTTAA